MAKTTIQGGDKGFDLDAFLPYQLSVLAGRVSRGLAAIYRERYGISVPEWRVLAHLLQSGRASVREIHARADMDKSKVSRAAAKLERSGYVTKRADPDDGRLVVLMLTPKGEALMSEIIPLALDYEGAALEALGAQDAALFRAMLVRLLEKTE